MFRISYISEVAASFGETDFTHVVRTSQLRNSRDDISGMLIYHKTSVLQILEGPEDKLRKCYSRIRRDPRHFGIQPLDKREIDSRAFSDWSMGIASIDEVEDLPTVSMHTFKEILERFRYIKNLDDLPDNTRHIISTISNFMSGKKIYDKARAQGSALR